MYTYIINAPRALSQQRSVINIKFNISPNSTNKKIYKQTNLENWSCWSSSYL